MVREPSCRRVWLMVEAQIPVEKRLILFFVLSTVIVVGHLFLQAKFAPPKPVAKDGGAQQAGDKKGDKQGNGKLPAENGKLDDPDLPDVKSPNDKPPPEKVPVDQAAEDKIPPPPKTVALQWVSLGSVDPSTGYRMLVTLNNRGAAVERIELSSPRYLDLEDKRGYLGHLALTNEPDEKGCRVNVVGAGTPAATAVPDAPPATRGLQVGDVIRAIDGEPVASVSGFRTAMAKAKPGEQIQLEVLRGGAKVVLTATLGRQPLKVIQPESEQYGGTGPDLGSFLLTLESIGSGKHAAKIPLDELEIPNLTSLHDGHWEITKATNTDVEFRFQLDDRHLKSIGQTGGLEIIKRFRLAPVPATDIEKADHKSYHLEMELEIRRLGDTPLQVAYRLDGPNGLPMEGWWYSNKVHPKMFSTAGARDVVYNNTNKAGGFLLRGCNEIFATAKKKSGENRLIVEKDGPEKRAFRYLGVDSQYFASVLLPKETAEMPLVNLFQTRAISNVSDVKKGWERTANISFQLASEPKTISADKPLKHEFVIFAGPKEKHLLEHYQLSSILYYGWWHYVVVVLFWVLHAFQSIVRNYGISIILLTVVVRSCMLPISFKMTKNAQKMQALAPELKKIAEKYKNEMDKRSRAQQELFKKHNVNMFSGCLLVFFQLPVFAGLYRLLAVDINLRQAPLIPGWEWCSNLAGPDQLWYWKDYLPFGLGEETGWLGPYLNVLPLITIALFLVNQKLMTPPATDEQTRMQQQVMKFMMIFMAVMFFKVPAGLCLYFIASSIWTLCEFKFLKKDKLLAVKTGKT